MGKTLCLMLIIVSVSFCLISCRGRRGQDSVKPVGEQKVMGEVEKRGELLYRANNYKVLIATYEKMLGAAPDNPEIKAKLAELHYELGKIEMELGNLEVAEADLDKALEFMPSHTAAKALLDNIREVK